MLVFPPCKINLGLNIVEKRNDGFHNIESVFYRVNWCDALEVVEGTGPGLEVITAGLEIPGKSEDNLIFKAFSLLNRTHKLPPLEVFLYKAIPMGAGLGGGSSDAAYFLTTLNKFFDFGLSYLQLKELASQIGSDCAFFVDSKAAYATQKGDHLETINLNLSQYYILLVFPPIISNTGEAYKGVVPKKSIRSPKEIVLNEPPENWKYLLVNDFEKSLFTKYPEIENIKAGMYKEGALYSSMSGSGSTVFGIFKEKPLLVFPNDHLCYLSEPDPIEV